MSTMPVSTVMDAIVVLLTEAYEGPPNPNETWFIDNEANSGVLGAIDSVSAKEASTVMGVSGQEGTTIAAIAEHLRWSVANANSTFRGQSWNPDWGESWKVKEVNEAAWDQLRQSLRAEFGSLRELLKEQKELQGEYLLGVLAMIPHAAFHLGMMRQLIERVRPV